MSAGDDPKAARDEAKRLEAEGDFAGALEKHVWFHDNALRSQPGLYGVRLSFALRDWTRLGEKYPPALARLKSIRDEKTARILGGTSDRELFHDVVSINCNLGESSASVDLFRQLDAQFPEFASSVYDLADEALAGAVEYELAKKYLGDPDSVLKTAELHYKVGMGDRLNPKQAEAAKAAHEHIFTEDVLRIIAILRETGEPEKAKEIQEKALKVLDNDRIRGARTTKG